MTDGIIGVLVSQNGEPILIAPYVETKIQIGCMEGDAAPLFIPDNPGCICAKYKGADEIMELLRSLDVFRGTKLTHNEEEKNEKDTNGFYSRI